MTTLKAKELTMAFCRECEKDGDPFLVVHFSRVQDRYEGFNDGMDAGDALIVIRELVKQFELDKEVIANM